MQGTRRLALAVNGVADDRFGVAPASAAGTRFIDVQPGAVLDAVVTGNRIAVDLAVGEVLPAHYLAVVVRVCILVETRAGADDPPVVYIDVQKLYTSLARNDVAAFRYAVPPGGGE